MFFTTIIKQGLRDRAQEDFVASQLLIKASNSVFPYARLQSLRRIFPKPFLIKTSKIVFPCIHLQVFVAKEEYFLSAVMVHVDILV